MWWREWFLKQLNWAIILKILLGLTSALGRYEATHPN